METELFDLHADIETTHWWFVGRRRIVNCLLSAAIPQQARQTVVDIGCGTGGNVAALDGWKHRVGVDVSSSAIAAAQSNYPEITFKQGEAPRDLSETELDADLFALMDVLEHVEDDESLLSEVVLQAKSGAHLLITVPANPALWSQHDVSFGHFRRYTAGSLARLWRDLPVETKLLSYFNSRLLPVIRTARFVSQLRGKSIGRDQTDFFIPPQVVNNLLTEVFAGEAQRLRSGLGGQGQQPLPFRRGVSLIAILHRN